MVRGRGLLDKLRGLRRQEEVVDEYERLLADELDEPFQAAVFENLIEARVKPGGWYHRFIEALKTTGGAALMVGAVFAFALLYQSVGTREVVLTDEYGEKHAALERFNEYTAYLGGQGVVVEKPKQLVELEEDVRAAVRYRDEFRSRGLAVKGVEDIHHGLTTRRKIGVWLDLYREWYRRPRTMDEMFITSLPIVGVLFLALIPLLAVHAIKGGRLLTVYNFRTQTARKYILETGDEKAGLERFRDPDFHLWTLPIVNPLTLSKTGRVDVYEEACFLFPPELGQNWAGVYAVEKGENTLGVSRLLFSPVPRGDGYWGYLAYEREAQLIDLTSKLNAEKRSLHRQNIKLDLELQALLSMTSDEHFKNRDQVVRHIADLVRDFEKRRQEDNNKEDKQKPTSAKTSREQGGKE